MRRFLLTLIAVFAATALTAAQPARAAARRVASPAAASPAPASAAPASAATASAGTNTPAAPSASAAAPAARGILFGVSPGLLYQGALIGWDLNDQVTIVGGLDFGRASGTIDVTPSSKGP